jgi:hypothetical protein
MCFTARLEAAPFQNISFLCLPNACKKLLPLLELLPAAKPKN